MSVRAVLAVLIALFAVQLPLGAQVRPDSSARAATVQKPDTVPKRDSTKAKADSLAQGRDTTTRRVTIPGMALPGADTTKKKRVLEFDPPDSIMNVLLGLKGYSVTRYQGERIVFDARDREMHLVGKRAMVSKDTALLVGDTIQFNDSTQVVEARGDTLILRDPSQQPDDIVALHMLRYDVQNRQGVMRDVTTTVQSGNEWVVHGGTAAIRGDTLSGGAGSTAFYALNGWLTSCTDSVPHYHFAASQLKMITKNVIVARPAVLYIADIPVFWLPFIFQDIRSGRRSGIIPPRFGFSDLIRNSPTYRRTIDNFGYYFAVSDYVSAQVTMDWRSDARPIAGQPGYVKFNGTVDYAVRDRFLNGSVGVSYHYLRDGSTNQQYSLSHTQQFSQRTGLTANLNYVTNTVVQQSTQINPFAAVQVIGSTLNFHSGRGPFTFTLGGGQKQYPGRQQIDRDFPSISVSSKPITVGEWLTWTPSLTMSNSQSLHQDQVGDFAYQLFQRSDGSIDSSKVDRSRRNSSIRFDTPLEIHGFSWRNSFSLTDALADFPQKMTIVDVADTSKREQRVFRRTYLTSLDWTTAFNVPQFSFAGLKIGPAVSFQKVDPAFGLLVRSERTGNQYASQSMRPVFGLSTAPTLYHIYPGFGPLAQIRHSISPSISFNYSPRASVSDDFLRATGRTRPGYLGANRQSQVSLGLNTVLEAKLRPSSDTVPPSQWAKVKLLSLNFSSLTYDFERARATGGTGLTNTTFDITARSDLLPGLDFGTAYSLFQGDPVSDTATFKPYRTTLRATLSLGSGSPLVRAIGRLLGLTESGPETPPGQAAAPPPPMGTSPSFVAGQPIAGSINRLTLNIPRGQGWQWQFSYSAQRSRPARGTGIVTLDPTADCLQFRDTDPYLYGVCVSQTSATTGPNGPGVASSLGGTYFNTPAQASAQSNLSFHVTPKWAAQWSTTYDFEQHQFASQIITLQREMHDWDAVFAFTRAPNGNFAFNFHIALKAQPDLKFDFDRRDYPRGYTGVQR